MRRISRVLFVAVMGLSAATFAADDAKKPAATKAPAKAPAKAAPAKKPPPKKVVNVSAEKKKALAELYGGFKFGMNKDDVLKVLSKQLDEKYEEKLKATTDMAAQDRLRKEKKAELARVASSFVSFEGKRTGWDVSIIEEEFAHNTGESMIERWENQGGKNQRRFFFFHDGKLWKMFISLDVSILPEDKKNFDTFKSVMQGKYGPGAVEPGMITWTAGEFQVRAIDKLKSYDALALAIEDTRENKEILALREAKKPPPQETSPVIKAVIDPDKKDHPDVKAGGNAAVDAVIKAQGGGTTEPKK
jgi:hypothetical protein